MINNNFKVANSKAIKELKNGCGYAVFSIERMDIFKKLRKNLFQALGVKKNMLDKVEDYRKYLSNLSNAEINKLMIRLLSYNEISEMFVKSCPTLIKNLCGKKLFIQRRAHTTVKLPGKQQLKTLPHYEMMSGISPFSYVIWAPLHDLDNDDGGIYYLDKKRSLKIMKEEHKEGIVNGPKILNMKINEKPASMQFGQAIIFNPFIMHGNNNFNSDLARLAINIRFQSYNKPLLQKNTEYLKYFELH
tara:strand:- start:854 stop:1591 length:738 start_codon:yes stop_codon:yes gene_type:complete